MSESRSTEPLDGFRPPRETPVPRNTRLLRIALLLLILYVFLTSIELISGTFKLMGKGFAEGLVSATSNPFGGLLIGVLATSLVQSSSTVTSLIVGLVASGAVGIEQAVPMIMGANIGTSITNTIVALGHMTRAQEFQRAFAGATVHDFFNLLAVTVFLPLEVMTGFLHRVAAWTQGFLIGREGVSFKSPLKVIIEPAKDVIENAVLGLIPIPVVDAVVLLVLGLAMLILSLRYLVVLMKVLMLGKVELLLHRYLFRHPVNGIVMGTIITILVQSSSVTTSITVPLLAAGLVSVEQVFPFVLGANVGTTITALLASMVTGSAAALTVALCHVYFNILGIVLLYPLRAVPIQAAKALGRVAVRSRFYAVAYVLLVFFAIPLALIALTR